ncbi:MAG: T9SS type A sorting domain-containing protein [Bacteroidota bacterium]
MIYSETIKDISGLLTKQIDLSALPKGTYFVELYSNSDKETKRVQKLVLQ